MGKYLLYAIAEGVDPTTGETVHDLKFTNWQECVPYIAGIRFARYKGFMNEQEADEWLAQKAGERNRYPALRQGVSAYSLRNNNNTVTQKSKRFSSSSGTTTPPKATPVSPARNKEMLLNYESGDMCNGIKFMFSERCMDLGLDPNEILLYLMEQWMDLTDKMHVVRKDKNNEEEDDFPPW